MLNKIATWIATDENGKVDEIKRKWNLFWISITSGIVGTVIGFLILSAIL